MTGYRIAAAMLAALAMGVAASVPERAGAGRAHAQTQAGPEAARPETRPEAGAQALTNTLALTNALYAEVNRVRRAAGAEPLRRDTGFEDIAGRHADDMAERIYMAHVTPEGLGPRDRLTARFPDYTGVLGENIALRSHRPGETPAATALAAVEAWLDSPPHRRNMLDPRHSHAGLAAASGPLALYIVLLKGSESTLAAPPPDPAPDPDPNAADPNAADGRDPRPDTQPDA